MTETNRNVDNGFQVIEHWKFGIPILGKVLRERAQYRVDSRKDKLKEIKKNMPK